MDNLNIINILINLVVFFILIIIGIKSKKKFLFLLSFLLPLTALNIDIGFSISWYKIIIIVGLIVFIIRKDYLGDKTFIGKKQLYMFIFYITFITITFWFYTANFTNKFTLAKYWGWGEFQSTYKFLIQYVSYLLTFGIIFIPYLFLKNKKDLESILNGYINGTIFSVIIGIYQIISFKLGIPIISYLKGWYSSRLITKGLLRLYGLSGEPKHIASYILYSIVILIIFLLNKNSKIYISNKYLKLTILIIGLILTGSTGGYIAFSIILCILLLQSIQIKKYRHHLYKKIPIILTIIFILIIWKGNLIKVIIQERLINRIAEGYTDFRYYEPKDGAFIEYIKSNPKALVFGHGAGGIDLYIIEYSRISFLEYGGTQTPAYFLTRILGDFGLIGLLLLIMMYKRWYKAVKNNDSFSALLKFLIIPLMFSSYLGIPAALLLSSSAIFYVSRVVLNNKDIKLENNENI
jgi:hypothetical protein